MNILVIGNGFDLAHGLPTKYQDFLEFVEYFKCNFIDDKDIKSFSAFNKENNHEKYIEYFRIMPDDIKEELIELIEDNYWFTYFRKTYNKKIKRNENWIDFEAEISAVVQELDRVRKELIKKVSNNKSASPIRRIMSFNLYKIPTEFSLNTLPQKITTLPAIKNDEFTLARIQNIKDIILNDLNRLTRCLELYLCDYISYKKCKILPLFENLKPDHVLNFNYTSTYSTVYLSLKESLGEKVPDIHYIHGRAIYGRPSEKCNLVLGIEEYLEGSEKDKDNEYIEFKKFYQRIFKGTGNNYKKWIEEYNLTKAVKKDKLYTYIFGHSIATTDGDVIKDLIEASTQTIIYYYRKSDLHDIILNLVQIIGEEELIKRTSSDNCSIVFKPNP